MKVTNVNVGRQAPAAVHRAWAAIAAAALALVLTWPAAAHAGSVFMKNGYIIQGRIVDRDAESIVLGWPNGKVAIAHRFVESVVLEPEEEERIRQLEEARRSDQNQEDDQTPSILDGPSTDEVELPPTLELFMLSYQRTPGAQIPGLPGGGDIGPLDSPDDVDLGVGGTDGGDPGSEPVTSVDPIQPPVLAPRSTHAGTGVAIEAPEGWEPVGTSEVLAYREPQGEGFRASFNVMTVDPVPTDRESFVELLREENRGQMLGYEELDEGPTTVAGQPGYRVLGRGTFGGQTAMVEQRLLVSGGKLWLVSIFTPEGGSDTRSESSRASIEASLASMEVGVVAGGEAGE